MSELDEKWALMLDSALASARANGRSDVADYLRLRAENDAVREVGLKWLFGSLIDLATAPEMSAAGIAVERVEPHNFADHGANMVGSMLSIRQGVRCLTLEGGWTRTPNDGFMRGGALATARIRHFGMKQNNAELDLVRKEGLVAWMERERVHEPTFDGDRLREHFDLFLGR